MADTIPFTLPQFQQDQLANQRQQIMAQMLSQEALKGPDLPSNLAIIPKMGAGYKLAKLAQALGAGLLLNKSLEGQQDLINKQNAYGMDMMSPKQTAPVSQTEVDQAALANPQAGVNPAGVTLGPTLGAAASQARLQPVVGTGGGSTPAPMNPANLPPSQAWQQYQRDPVAYTKDMVAPFVTPAPGVKEQTQAGLSPSEIRRAALAKILHDTTTTVGPDTNVQQPFTMPGVAPLNGHTATASPPNSNVVPNPADPTQISAVTPQPGAAGQVASNAFAGAAGTNAAGVTGYQGTGGEDLKGPTSMFMDPRALALLAGQGLPPPAQGSSGPGAVGTRVPPPPNPAITRVAQGQSTAAKNVQSDFGTRYASEVANVQGRQDAVNGLKNAIDIMHTAPPTTGPGSELANQWVAKVANLTGNKDLTDRASAYQELHKFVANAQNQMISSLGGGAGGSDARTAETKAGLPDIGSQNLPALERAARYVGGQLEGSLDRTAYVGKASGGNPSALGSAYEDWGNKKYDAKYYETKWSPVPSAPPTNLTVGQMVNTPKGVMRFTGKDSSGMDHYDPVVPPALR